jgi:hypothetical protein
MDQPATKLARNASIAVLYPIGGLLAGLFVGALRATIKGPNPIDQLVCVLRWGISGFFLGLFLIVIAALNLRTARRISIRGLMAFILIAALLSWYITRVLFGVLGPGGF